MNSALNINGSSRLVALHENVRLMVVELLKQLYGEILHRLVSSAGRRDYVLLEKLLSAPEFLPLIMPQEIYAVDGSRNRVDMAFGKSIIFELKSDRSEFDKAYEDALSKYLPSPHLASSKYFIITDYNYWRIYKINRTNGKVELKPIVVDEPRSKIVPILRTQILPEIEPRLPAHPDIIGKLFTIEVDLLVTHIRNVFTSTKKDSRIKPLYEAYKKIMEMLYGKASENFFEDLFARHTLMHMIVVASLSKALNKKGIQKISVVVHY